MPTNEKSEKQLITNHGYKRAKERLGLNPKALENLLENVKEKGIHHTQIKGSFRRYLDRMFILYGMKEIKIYGEYIFTFSHDGALITTFILPTQFKKIISKLNKKAFNATL